MIKVASVCSGIGGAELAFAGIADHVFAAEIDQFARAVLAQRFPHLVVHHDFTEITSDGPVDVLVGGTPCQSFSIAGLRGGMADARGNLALEFLRLADRLRARWVLWENVPGVLSSSGGRDFGAFLGGLGQLGYGFAYRVLDAQYFGLAQRRKRVFVVGYLRDWRRAAAVLFEPASLRGDSAPSRAAREGIAGTLAAGAHPSGFNGRGAERGNIISNSLRAQAQLSHRADSDTYVTHSLRADGFDASEDGTGRGTPLVAFNARQSGTTTYGDMSGSLDTDGHSVAVAWSIMPQNSSKDYKAREVDVAQPLMGNGPVGGNQGGDYIQNASSVRRLTPKECERLQGFPDDWTAITHRGKQAADGPRYRALGNAFAVPVVRWIARRMVREDALGLERAA